MELLSQRNYDLPRKLLLRMQTRAVEHDIEYCLLYEITWHPIMSPPADDQLDEAVKAILGRHPNYGEKMVNGCLLSKNILIQRDRIRDAIRRVDPNGVSERRKQSLHRREYYVPGPNSLWHIDGNHKLIRIRSSGVHGGQSIETLVSRYLSIEILTNHRWMTHFNWMSQAIWGHWSIKLIKVLPYIVFGPCLWTVFCAKIVKSMTV
ncbi:hypothetical protein HOLleu_01149 [Holothuria leucospilota]|uniref:Integrase core domain-containing protein n=1 Tax=Holothuria leucospilota TaxID=206669 RepID=A0A9Q1HJ28_HOLLE|nr:hypothetical protein HOLleu_01149 [Holothuria leucospilota]